VVRTRANLFVGAADIQGEIDRCGAQSHCLTGFTVRGGGRGGVDNAVDAAVIDSFLTLFVINVISTGGMRFAHPRSPRRYGRA
jgi:hypothetical protein